jgi:hypothetical protein
MVEDRPIQGMREPSLVLVVENRSTWDRAELRVKEQLKIVEAV